MKKVFAYISIILFLASCSSEDTISNTDVEIEKELDGQYVEVEPIEMDESLVTRSTLYYLYTEKKAVFSWGDNDQIGVFAVAKGTNEMDKPDKKSQAIYRLLSSNSDNASDLFREFEPAPGVQPIAKSTEYVACHPIAQVGKVGYTDIPFSLLSQTQMAPVEMYYYPFSGNPNVSIADYLQSEKDAASHLSPKDYLASPNQTTSEQANIIFHMKRMGAIVRFYIKAPNNLKTEPKKEMVYETLHLTCQDESFLGFDVKGEMDLSNRSFVNTEKSKVVSLTFNCPIDYPTLENVNGDGVIDDNGLDMSLTSKCVYNGVGYIVAYMMVAPVDLRGYKENSLTLYLAAHEKGNPENKHYYKATNLARPELYANRFYQWTVANADEDTPIEFTTITVEEWRKGTDIDNNGAGTSKW